MLHGSVGLNDEQWGRDVVSLRNTITAYRRSRGLTKGELAQAIGCSEEELEKIEEGRRVVFVPAQGGALRPGLPAKLRGRGSRPHHHRVRGQNDLPARPGRRGAGYRRLPLHAAAALSSSSQPCGAAASISRAVRARCRRPRDTQARRHRSRRPPRPQTPKASRFLQFSVPEGARFL